MARTLTSIVLAALVFATTGCVSQDQYNALKLDRDKLASQLAQSQNECQSLKATVDAMKQNSDGLMNSGLTRDALMKNYTDQIAELQRQLGDVNAKYADAIRNVNPGGIALPKDVSDRLAAFAAQNSDLLGFDASTGIVKFKSDLTFSPGDHTLTSQAREAIKRFSAILNSGSAEHFELVVAGHTDDTHVVNPATIAKGNLDNWFLSCHRAISVSEALMADGVNPTRIGATGYADCRPCASNSTSAGKAQNRRVEVLILPNSIRTAHIASGHVKPARGAVTKDDNVITPSPSK